MSTLLSLLSAYREPQHVARGTASQTMWAVPLLFMRLCIGGSRPYYRGVIPLHFLDNTQAVFDQRFCSRSIFSETILVLHPLRTALALSHSTLLPVGRRTLIMAPTTSVPGAINLMQSPRTVLSQSVPTLNSPSRKRDAPHQVTSEAIEKPHKRPTSRSGSISQHFNKKPRIADSVQYPLDGSIVRWDNDNEKQNSALQLVWDQKMQEGKQYTSTKCYKEVHVLMLSWDPQSDDLKVKKEMERLGTVFQEDYNFEVHPAYLKNNTNKLPRNQAQKYVSDFVYDYDSPHTLLVVYFGGHGTPGDHGGELQLHGNVDQVKAHRNGIIWNHVSNPMSSTLKRSM